MNLFYQPLIPEGVHILDPDESRHCIKVLRKTVGDRIDLTDGKGNFYEGIIQEANALACRFNIKKSWSPEAKMYAHHIAISPTKNADRIEWFVEKSVELGVDIITLLRCENTERTHIKLERLQKVAVSAMKQSLKPNLPRIETLTHFSDLLETHTLYDQCYIAYVDGNNPKHLKNCALPNKKTIVLIGPEGDFSPSELSAAMEKGFEKISLGTSRLRTETAGVAACHILNLMNG